MCQCNHHGPAHQLWLFITQAAREVSVWVSHFQGKDELATYDLPLYTESCRFSGIHVNKRCPNCKHVTYGERIYRHRGMTQCSPLFVLHPYPPTCAVHVNRPLSLTQLTFTICFPHNHISFLIIRTHPHPHLLSIVPHNPHILQSHHHGTLQLPYHFYATKIPLPPITAQWQAALFLPSSQSLAKL